MKQQQKIKEKLNRKIERKRMIKKNISNSLIFWCVLILAKSQENTVFYKHTNI